MTQPELKRFIAACLRHPDAEAKTSEGYDALELAREGLRRYRARV